MIGLHETILAIMIFCTQNLDPRFDQKACIEHVVECHFGDYKELEDCKEFWQ